MDCVCLTTTGSNLQQLTLVPYEISESEEEAEDQPLMTSTPRHPKLMPLVSAEVNSGAMICPVDYQNKQDSGDREECTVKDDQNDQEVEEEGYPVQHEGSDKDRCPSNIYKMKKPSFRTWWVSCCKCGQWFHIRCVNLYQEKGSKLVIHLRKLLNSCNTFISLDFSCLCYFSKIHVATHL